MKYFLTIIILSSVLALGVTGTHSKIRRDREEDVVNMLIKIRMAQLEHELKTKKFIIGNFSIDEINQLLDLNLKLKQRFLPIENKRFQKTSTVSFELENTDDGFQIIAKFSKRGSAFLRDMFDIRITSKPTTDLYPKQNPCCIDYGRCPSLLGCTLGK